MFKLKIDYPTAEEELVIMQRVANQNTAELNAVLQPEQILQLREAIQQIYIDDKINDYIVRLIIATRDAKQLNRGLERYIQFGASPRATIFLNQAAKALAFLQGRGYVTPQDVKDMAWDILRHRLLLTFEAEAEGLSTDDVLKQILDHVEVP